MEAQTLISQLKLEPLAGEGGLWSPIYRDRESNAIYFMMVAPDFSAWHRLKEQELWVHLRGEAIELFTIESNQLKRTVLGDGGALSYRVPADTWMAARPLGHWALALCALTPPFSGMELAERSTLRETFAKTIELPDLFHD
ncbi:MAG: hypothetical protein EBZ66_00215 [Actinobacteria bacterium]|nr:hypothetical protein [Actinomycetota bacterium]